MPCSLIPRIGNLNKGTSYHNVSDTISQEFRHIVEIVDEFLTFRLLHRSHLGSKFTYQLATCLELLLLVPDVGKYYPRSAQTCFTENLKVEAIICVSNNREGCG